MKSCRRWALLLGVALAALFSPLAEFAAARPNILLLVSDDQRPDTIAALGNKWIETPSLDRLVQEGSAFTRAVCPNPICTPSRAEILTGVNSFRNGVIDFGGRIKAGLITWAQAMQQAGYRTYYVGKWHNNGRPSDHGYVRAPGLYSGGGGRYYKPQVDFRGRSVTGYRGWIFQSDAGEKFPEQGVGLTPDISRRFADAAIEVIEKSGPEPFFLHVNFTAPHDPLLWPPGYREKYENKAIPPPANFATEHPFDHGNFDGRDEKLLPWPRTKADVRAELACYYAVISHMDAQIGRILAALEKDDKAENTIVIFTSDHGLAVGSHGLRGKQNMYEHTIGVPLVMRGPGIPRGEKFAAQVYLRDLYPTACELAEVPIPATVQAKSFAPVLRGEQDTLHHAVFAYFRNYQRMIRTDRWKLIFYPHLDRAQLFDLKNDPQEMRDLADSAEHQRVRQRLLARLTKWRQGVDDPSLAASDSP